MNKYTDMIKNATDNIRKDLQKVKARNNPMKEVPVYDQYFENEDDEVLVLGGEGCGCGYGAEYSPEQISGNTIELEPEPEQVLPEQAIFVPTEPEQTPTESPIDPVVPFPKPVVPLPKPVVSTTTAMERSFFN